MKVAIMQPYFLPYIGYFQLVAAVDTFVIYDNIKYTKKGWINRNRFLLNGHDEMFSLPLAKASDNLTVAERRIAEDFRPEKLLNQLKGAYHHAPFFGPTWELLLSIMHFEERNLFAFILHSVTRVCRHLGIDTPIRTSSTIPIDHSLKSQDKVIALCASLGADSYLNPIGGTSLYSRAGFEAEAIDLRFLKAELQAYDQMGGTFIPWLSIIDVMMFNPAEKISGTLLKGFTLVDGEPLQHTP
jgi:hypothetical protein